MTEAPIDRLWQEKAPGEVRSRSVTMKLLPAEIALLSSASVADEEPCLAVWARAQLLVLAKQRLKKTRRS